MKNIKKILARNVFLMPIVGLLLVLAFNQLPIFHYIMPVLFPAVIFLWFSKKVWKLSFKMLIPFYVLVIFLLLSQLPYFNLLISFKAALLLFLIAAALLYPFSVRVYFGIGLILLLLNLSLTLVRKENISVNVGDLTYGIFAVGLMRVLMSNVKNWRANFSLKVIFNRRFSWLKSTLMATIFALLAFLTRFVLANNFYGTLDTSVHIDLVNIFLRGQNVYTVGNYAYPPLWLGILVFLRFISDGFGISNLLLLRMPSILSDVALTVLIFVSVFKKKHSLTQASLWSALFALNPIAILVSGYHGQIDTIWLFFSILTWYIFEFFPASLRQTVIAAVTLSIGIALKVFPIVFLPLFLMKMESNKRRIVFTIISIAPCTLSMIGPFLTSYHAVMSNFVNYGIELDFWGISALSGWLFLAFPQNRLIYYIFRGLRKAQIDRFPLYMSLLVAYIFLFKYRKRWTLAQGMFFITLIMMIMTPFISIQWFVWIVPVAIIAHEDLKKFFFYTITITYVLVVRYYLYIANIPPEYQFLQPKPIWHGIVLDQVNRDIVFVTWLVLCLWLFEIVKKIYRNTYSL